ncbi:MAG: hypothetical protein HUJ25_15275 [Crocinitomicaceae bacterium]|nr:hypothetical protein [Crocinitomicaceae bacterium]
MLNKSAKKDKIKKRIAELNKAAAKYKPITYIVYGVFFVLHLLGLLAFGIFDNSNFLIAFALFAVFIVFAIILFWLKGASIIPPVEFEESDYDF